MNHWPIPGRRTALRWITVALASTSVLAMAQSFPARPVKLIVPSAPGDGSDIMARVIAQKLQERWGQPVTVENRGLCTLSARPPKRSPGTPMTAIPTQR